MSVDQHLEFSKRLSVFQLSLEEGNGSGFLNLEFLVHGPLPASSQDPAQLLVLPAGLYVHPLKGLFNREEDTVPLVERELGRIFLGLMESHSA